ncbi:MAG TPA: hypothetical protein VGM77_00880 [Gemmatimonadales bacterium]|jgi:hypothetical protein
MKRSLLLLVFALCSCRKANTPSIVGPALGSSSAGPTIAHIAFYFTSAFNTDTIVSEDSVWSDNSSGDSVIAVVSGRVHGSQSIEVVARVRRFTGAGASDPIDEGPNSTRLLRLESRVLQLDSLPARMGGRELLNIVPRELTHQLGLDASKEYVDQVEVILVGPRGKMSSVLRLLAPI